VTETVKAANEPRGHHYVPQFLLRNFAVDGAKSRITTVVKHGSMAIWAERPIKSLGYERDFYVHMEGGIPVSVETDINRRVETPISRSETWTKIAAGHTDALNQSDRAILYALIRHLEVRTPHYCATRRELAHMAIESNSAIPFTDDERAYYAVMRANPNLTKATLNNRTATLMWPADNFRGALLMILRSPIPLRSSTTPVLSMPAPAHVAMSLPLPGMAPYQLALTLNPTTMACLVLGDFDGAFSNQSISHETALGLNRNFVAQFGTFEHVRHLITSRDNLADDMTWAPYDLIEDTQRKITFRRRAGI
jgi:hypothetical protein